jgi:hypothetical protein
LLVYFLEREEKSGLPVTETQCAQPAAALRMEASEGRRKASGVSLTKFGISLQTTRKKLKHKTIYLFQQISKKKKLK